MRVKIETKKSTCDPAESKGGGVCEANRDFSNVV